MSEKDLADIRQRIDQWAIECDREFVVRLIDTFLADAPKRLAMLHEAFERGVQGEFIRAAHTLKSSSGQLGANHYAEGAKRVELAARAGHMAVMAESIAWLEREFATLREFLLTLRGNYDHATPN